MKRLGLYAPLALHVLPTLAIGYGFMLLGSPIASVNQYTIGFAVAVSGFIPSYSADVRLARGTPSYA
ncbi:MAG: hypothetical protein K2P94_15980 [Rhodospirillaceae bacterium]|nr:hypothetical protein [Rhodospirillaceae bacterium]